MDIPFISIVGAVFLIGLGIVMMNNGVEVKTGEDIANTVVNGTIVNQTTTTNYTPYDFGGIGNTSFAWITLLLGLLLTVYTIATAGD